MLYSTVELVTQVTLNSHFVFCFCNIIIVFLLIDRAKTNSCPGVSTSDPLPLPVYLNSHTKRDDHEKYDNVLVLKEDSSEESVPKEEVVEETETVIAEVKAETEAEAEAEAAEEKTEETEEEDDVDDEELRRRIEEFINKVNKEWRKEKLRASCETD